MTTRPARREIFLLINSESQNSNSVVQSDTRERGVEVRHAVGQCKKARTRASITVIVIQILIQSRILLQWSCGRDAVAAVDSVVQSSDTEFKGHLRNGIGLRFPSSI